MHSTQNKVGKIVGRKLRGQSGGIDALIILAVVIAVAAIIALAIMRMGQSAASATRAQVLATVGTHYMTVEVQVLSGKLNQLYVQYWPENQPNNIANTPGSCYTNSSGSTPVSSTELSLYSGQSAVCYFPLSTTPGVQYSYVIIGYDANGRVIQLSRGVFTAGAS